MRHLYNTFANRPTVNLDISNKCTLECIACSRQTNRFAGNPIPGYDTSISQWTKMCKHFKKLCLCGQISDPIFNPNLHKFIEIAKEHKINYLSIDTEGTEYEIIKGLDFNEFYPEIITIEHNYDKEKRDQIYDLLKKQNYNRYFKSISRFEDWYIRPLSN